MNTLVTSKTLKSGERVDIGSDWHFDLDQLNVVNGIVDNIRARMESDILFLPGDLFDTPKGQDSSGAIREVLKGVAPHAENIVFTPGNHDLRGQENPWDDFQGLPSNIITPNLDEVKLVELGPKTLLAANLFYDMDFIDPEVIGMTAEQIEAEYAKSNDGQHFLNGETGLFKDMTKLAAQNLTPDINILATHALPHPSLVQFAVAEMTADIVRLADTTGLDFTCDTERDQTQADRFRDMAAKRGETGDALLKYTPQAFRDWWNAKSMYMGSNLLGHKDANPRDQITAVFGHHHRAENEPREFMNGKQFHPLTHQPNQQQKAERNNDGVIIGGPNYVQL